MGAGPLPCLTPVVKKIKKKVKNEAGTRLLEGNKTTNRSECEMHRWWDRSGRCPGALQRRRALAEERG